ncbi:hypothetical protein PFISCL1PPCAC_14690, partial [Pristionchus fissidentatus]
ITYCSLFGRKDSEMSKRFDKALDKATDPTLLEPNWDAILDCVDQIRAGEIPAKTAVIALRKKLLSDNPHSVLNALLVLDACVKNCGSKVHTEISTREFMTEYRELVMSKSELVRDKALEMLQCWSMAFVTQPAYKLIVDTHNLLKLSGFTFPPLKDPESMYIAQVAPEWVDGDKCYRCRTEFGMFTRKHHCRACGQIFCDPCSSKNMALPLLGIEKPVRVCDSCSEKGVNAGRNTTVDGEAKKKMVAAAADKEKELKEKEEEELQLALAISQSEAEAKERERKMYSIYNGDSNGASRVDDNSSIAPSESLGYRGTAPSMADNDLGVANDDPLAKYLNRDYWEKKTEDSTIKKIEDWKISTPVVTVPPLSEFGSHKDSAPSFTLPPTPTVMGVQDDQAATESINFCDKLKEQVTMMDSRIRSNIARGRSIINDSAIETLFEKLTGWHSEVLGRMAKLDEERVQLESLQDHLAHIGEARQAMDALRDEHGRRMREEEEERRRQKQANMHYKLEMMRAKKHEMLMNQRHAALERFQQNEMMHRMGGYGIAPPSQGMQPPQGMQQPQYGQYPGHPGHPGMYGGTPQGYTGEQNGGQSMQPVQQLQQGHPQMQQSMVNGQHAGMGYGVPQMQQQQQIPHQQQMEQQSIHAHYHMGHDTSMAAPPSANGVADHSIQSIPPSHLQYAPVPQVDQSMHSIPSVHPQYTSHPAPPNAAPQEEQSNLLISFD